MERIYLDYGPFQDMSDEGIDLLKSLMERNPVHRATAAEVGWRCLWPLRLVI